MKKLAALLLATPLVLASIGLAETQAERDLLEKIREEKQEMGEKRDHAKRRARAFEDMYADEFGRIDSDMKLRAAWHNQMESRQREPNAIGGTAWTNLGPTNVAGRTSAIAVDPTNGSIIYLGTAGGGIWKTTNGGTSWTVLTDSLGDLSIGAVVFGGNAQTLYVGTGEGAYGGDAIGGIGFIKSTDGGSTWSLPVSVNGASKFFALNVHPTNANEILAATSAGLQLSTDGGASWTTPYSAQVGTDLQRDPANANNVIASTWDVLGATATWKGYIRRSTDGGRTWGAAIGGDSVAPFVADTGRISFSAMVGSTVYALAASASGDAKNCSSDPVDQRGVFRSTDAGATWTFRSNPTTGSCGSYDSILAGQGWYASTIIADPTNANIVYAGGLDTWKSTDGGATFSRKSYWAAATGASNYVHADIHDMKFVGTDLLIACDGGLHRTTNGATSFTGHNTGIVTRQYYAMAVTAANRNLVIGGAQDNGTNLRTTSTTSFVERIGGDGFGVAAHPTNANTMYGTVYNSRVFRSTDGGTNFPEITPTFGGTENRPFISPLTMDPNNGSILYTGSQFLYKTSNGGTSWTKTSTTDLGDGTARGYLTKIAVAKSNGSYILTGTGSGQVKQSTNGGTTWSAALAGGLPTKYVAHVEYDPTNTSVFYVSYAGGTTGGRIFRTANGGTSFTQIDTGVPNFPVHVIRVDPTDSATLYAGTDLGLYRSTDTGATWARFGTGLPPVSIWDIAILPDGSMVRAATHGRGFWELTITGGNTAPTASITSPASDVTITAGGSVSFTGSATDAQGDAMTYAWTFGDGGTSTALAPGAHTYATAGTYAVTFKATDSKGAASTTQTRTITVNPIGGTLPESAHNYANSFDFTWTYTLTGSPSSINVTFDALTKVETNYDYIYVMDKNGVNIAGSPFTNTTLAGATKNVVGDTVKIRLTSDASVVYWGFRVTSVTAGSTGDPTPPTVSISSPAAGATITGATTVSATAADNVGVTKVEFYLDGVLQTTDTTSPYSWSWSPTSASNGSHSLTAKAFDAATNSTTSTPVSVTVNIATGCTPAQLIVNGGFESGATTWTATSGVITSSTSRPSHAGSWKAWLLGNGATATETLAQTVTIPACSTTATLSFWIRIDTAETTTTSVYDTVKVQVRNTAGTVLGTLATYSNLNKNTTYTQKSFSLAAYKGQTVQVYFLGAEDASLQTSFVVDDVALNTN